MRCLIVGGGRVAERKCSALIRRGAIVTVVSPLLSKRLERYKECGLITHRKRGYRRGDMKSVFVVIAATDSEETNRKVAGDAAAGNKLVNVVDNPTLCNFIVPSIVRRGLLTIAISTGGASPAFAKAVRKELEKLYRPGLSQSLKVMRGTRTKAIEEIADKKKRKRFLTRLAGRVLASQIKTVKSPERKGRSKR